MLAAIEVYNKPNFEHRIETFSILAFNAWELLLKARILQVDRNRLDAIIEYEKRRNAGGELSKQQYKKKNRSGNYVSIGLFKAYDRLVNKYGDAIDPLIRTNLEALAEIRDNAVHFVNRGLKLEQAVQEIGTATLKNFMSAVRQWFGLDLLNYNFYLMPLAFFRDFHTANVVMLNAQEENVIQFLSSLRQDTDDDGSKDFSLALEIELKLRKAATGSSQGVQITNDPTAPSVRLQEEDIREKYPWTYAMLTKRLLERYSDFKRDKKYHRIRRTLEKDQRYCNERLLDPGNPKSAKKRFYNPNIINEFDKHYTRAVA